jgi:CubicO group peptidase (beta-lactamase class C family)
MTRGKRILAAWAAAVAVSLPAESSAQDPTPASPTSATRAEAFPATGEARPQLATVDAWAREFLSRQKVPGATLAVAREGTVVYARGYGWTDAGTKTAVEPNRPFAVGPAARVFTSAALLKLAEEGKVKPAEESTLAPCAVPRPETAPECDRARESLVAKASGRSYESYVTDVVLKPLDLLTARYDAAAGGWVASAIDLVKFSTAFDAVQGRTRGGLLMVEHARSLFPAGGAGGALPGHAAVLLRLPEDTHVALVASQSHASDGSPVAQAFETPLANVVREVKAWPCPCEGSAEP